MHQGADGERPDICVGFLCSLPEVIEASRARLHWSKGALREWAGSKPSRRLFECIETLEVAANQAEGWAMKNPEKG
jgi:hypothetical protein